jgi:hypothetical protein
MRLLFACVCAAGMSAAAADLSPAATAAPPGKPEVAPPPRDIDTKATKERLGRWVLRFRVKGGEDYVAQLAALDAVVVVPTTPDNKRFLLFSDLTKPETAHEVTADDLKPYASRFQLSDNRPQSVQSVCEALGVKGQPKMFWVYFSRELERDLARKEVGYRGRRVEDIKQTIFTTFVRDGKCEFVVVDQVLMP